MNAYTHTYVRSYIVNVGQTTKRTTVTPASLTHANYICGPIKKNKKIIITISTAGNKYPAPPGRRRCRSRIHTHTHKHNACTHTYMVHSVTHARAIFAVKGAVLVDSNPWVNTAKGAVEARRPPPPPPPPNPPPPLPPGVSKKSTSRKSPSGVSHLSLR